MLEEMRQIQIEQPVIGSLLLWPEKLRDRLTELEEEDFTVCGGLFALLRAVSYTHLNLQNNIKKALV